jgi:hypothetical protein
MATKLFSEKVFDLNDQEILGRVTVPHEKDVSLVGWMPVMRQASSLLEIHRQALKCSRWLSGFTAP